MTATVADLLSVLALMGSGTVAGVLFAVALSTLPALIAMPPGRYVYAQKMLGRNWDPTMPVLVLSSTLIEIVLAVLMPGTAAVLLFGGAAVSLLGVSVVSHWCNVPINRQTRELDPDRMPDDWHDPRPLWRRWHFLRTALAMLALACTAVAVTIA
ncbi:DUF1772 domain-containing protein [Amycolatopsis coloradensis]|uniref:DUF1772 domain-containing protein n=1 Tax=Amycolatopsis coloradensis TaxID=76021 RepID=A0ACD5BJK4_9PSEU